MRGAAAMAGMAAVIAAAGVTIAVSGGAGPSKSPLPPGRIALPAEPIPSGPIAGVGMIGKLHYDGRCLYLDFPAPVRSHKVSIVWTPGWTFQPSTGLLYDPSGRVSGKTGETFQGGGLILSEQRSPGSVPKNACIASGSAETFRMLDVEIDPFLAKRYPQN